MCPTASFLATGGSSFSYYKIHAWSTNMLLLYSTIMLNVVKMLLKGKVGGRALNSHGKSWENHGIVVLNLCGNPELPHFGAFHVVWVFNVCHNT